MLIINNNNSTKTLYLVRETPCVIPCEGRRAPSPSTPVSDAPIDLSHNPASTCPTPVICF